MKKINYGFDESLVQKKPEDYVFGGFSKLPNTKYRSDGQWQTPLYEPQAEKYETSGCTVWGSENQAEMFTKEVFGFEPNFDERFTYIKAGVTLDGANPHNAYESIRNDGVIDNEPLPDTYAEFIDRAYITKERVSKGLSHKGKYDFLHEWVEDTSKENIKEVLQFSPVGLSVTAWNKNGDGLYTDGGRPNTHWCTAFGYVTLDDISTSEKLKALTNTFAVSRISIKKMVKEGKVLLKIFDSYDHSHKILHPEHRIAVAKRIWVGERKEGTAEDKVIATKVYVALKKINALWYFEIWWDFFIKRVRGLIDPGSLGGARSPKWPQVRKEHLRKNPFCKVCGTTKKIEVHHKIPVHVDPSRELDSSNLESLCDRDHIVFGHLGSYHSYNAGIEEDLATWQEKLRTRP